MSQLRIEGRSIDLRDWRLSDLGLWRRWMAPGQAWKETDAPYYPLPTEEDTDRLVAARRREIEEGKWTQPRRTLVIADRADDRLIGTVTWYWESIHTHWPGAGLAIFDPARWGQGRGYQALGLWSDYLFGSVPFIQRLDLRTWSGNVGMMRLAAKLGFREEARFRRARIVKGAYYDALGYGILRQEWEGRYPRGFAAVLGLQQGDDQA